MGVTIINGALSRDHVHMFVEIPPHVSVSDFVRRAKGRSSRKIQQEFDHIRKRYWGQRFWQRGYFSTTRSEEHTSELQSLMRISYAVFCLKQKTQTPHNI